MVVNYLQLTDFNNLGYVNFGNVKFLIEISIFVFILEFGQILRILKI